MFLSDYVKRIASYINSAVIYFDTFFNL
jgi:hypothetical protein